MKLERRLNNIFYVTFPTREATARTLLRFEESYESPHFRGKVFTRREFEDWYRQNCQEDKEQSCTYYKDWFAFGLPSKVLKPFTEGKFNPLEKEEQDFLQLFKGIREKFYIVATEEGDESAMIHETAHGLWYTNQKYKREAARIIQEMDLKKKATLRKILISWQGYNPSRLTDELHANILVPEDIIKEGIKEDEVKKEQRALEEIYKRYTRM